MMKEEYSYLLIKHILGGNAFKKIEDILEEMPFEKIGLIPTGLPYSFWQVFDHIKIAQKDILEFSINPDYKAIKWPDDYWPRHPAPESEELWEKTKEDFFNDRVKLTSLLESRADQLLEPFTHGDGQNLFREALLVLEHNAYHIGQLMIIARLFSGNKL
jgi:hypothetical protein